jgi:hypothetical protein
VASAQGNALFARQHCSWSPEQYNYGSPFIFRSSRAGKSPRPVLLGEGTAHHENPIVSMFNRRLNLVAFICNGVKDVPDPVFCLEMHSVLGILGATDNCRSFTRFHSNNSHLALCWLLVDH